MSVVWNPVDNGTSNQTSCYLTLVARVPSFFSPVKKSYPHPQVPHTPQLTLRPAAAAPHRPGSVLALRPESLPRMCKRLLHKLFAPNKESGGWAGEPLHGG